MVVLIPYQNSEARGIVLCSNKLKRFCPTLSCNLKSCIQNWVRLRVGGIRFLESNGTQYSSDPLPKNEYENFDYVFQLGIAIRKTGSVNPADPVSLDVNRIRSPDPVN
ncbi:hypothetical protein AVEN_3941-1 [Araneus ventricosus]|uniref:Uncharacterized protein n=1 Tax=Araneus ventricosus TaxID=182803 RepID=A0A4Y2JWZ6_ARAVE|nr:hypothetical protein AVEN_3941-1 [Araneus ventricosus]